MLVLLPSTPWSGLGSRKLNNSYINCLQEHTEFISISIVAGMDDSGKHIWLVKFFNRQFLFLLILILGGEIF